MMVAEGHNHLMMGMMGSDGRSAEVSRSQQKVEVVNFQ
jgi:hypothetical protein